MRRQSGRATLVVCLFLVGTVLWGCGAAPSTPASSESPTPSTMGTPTERLSPLALDEVAYVEITHPTWAVVSAEDRVILSPAIDTEAISEILGAYSEASVVHDHEPRHEDMDVQLVIHLRDGSALVLSGDLDQEQPGLIVAFEGRLSGITQGERLHQPSLLAVVQASGLFAAAERASAVDASTIDPTGGAVDAIPPDMPADFGFVAAFGVYGKMVLDTFTCTFHKDMVLPQYTTSTAALNLTATELQEAYARLVALDPISYPTDFIPKQNGGITPNEAYYLRFRAGGVEKEIRWNDSTLSDDRKANELRNWFKWLQGLIYEKPEYRALPDFRGGYA